MVYRYKRPDQGHIMKHEARPTVHRDRMQPHTHFNPDDVSTYTAKRPTIRTLMCLAAALNLSIEQFDISIAFLHEKCDPDTTVYDRQHLRPDGTYKHLCTIGNLFRNLYCSLSDSSIYFEASAKFLTFAGYTQVKSDPCDFLRHTLDGSNFLTITNDDFSVASASPKLTDQ